MRVSVDVVYGLSCMWNLPGPGIEPVSPEFAGGFLNAGPPGKSLFGYCLEIVRGIQKSRNEQITPRIYPELPKTTKRSSSLLIFIFYLFIFLFLLNSTCILFIYLFLLVGG